MHREPRNIDVSEHIHRYIHSCVLDARVPMVPRGDSCCWGGDRQVPRARKSSLTAKSLVLDMVIFRLDRYVPPMPASRKEAQNPKKCYLAGTSNTCSTKGEDE